MGKKRNKKNNLNRWLTANRPDQKDSFIQVGESLATHPVFKTLSITARYIYERMSVYANYAKNNNELDFTFPRSVYCGKYGISSNAFHRAIKDLIEKGFVRCVLKGKNQRVASKYRMVQVWKIGNPLNGCPQTGRHLSQNGTPNAIAAPNIGIQHYPRVNIKIEEKDEPPHEA